MIRKILGLAGVFLLVAAVRQFFPGPESAMGTAGMALGFVLVVSFLLGRAIAALGLPSIAGYILVGMAFGPHLLATLHPAFAVLDKAAVDALQLLDSLALGLIALTAGGELRLATLRAQAGQIGAVIAGQGLLVAGGVGAAVLLLSGTAPLLREMSAPQTLAVAILFGVAALANSPATALAIVQEYRARGPLTDLVLAVTVAKDVVVISLFTVALPFAEAILRPAAGFQSGALLQVAWEVGGSLAGGWALGWLVAQYLKRVAREVPLVVLAVAFCAVALLPGVHLSGVLACMVAGFYIENFSPHGDDLIQGIERHALPVYVVFFTIAGAALDLQALAANWGLALALAGARLVLTAAGTALGAGLLGAPRGVTGYGWSGFIAQAGVTLGFALLAKERFPEIGGAVSTLILATVALNQVLGPLLFRLGLVLAREIPVRES